MAQNSFDAAQFLRDNKTKALGFGVFTVLVILILVAGAIIPSASAVLKLRTEISQKQYLYDNLEKKVTSLSNLSQQIDNADNLESFENLPLVFPADKDYSLTLLYIKQISDTYNYQVLGIAFPAAKETQSTTTPLTVLKPQSVNVNISGSIVNLVGYMQDIEALPMYPTVESVSYSNNPDQTGNFVITLRITIYDVENSLFYK